MRILYENADLIVCVKPVGVLSEDGGGKANMPSLLRENAAQRGEKNAEFFSVHRLDRDVGGVMVYAKNRKTASMLTNAIRERRIEKEYFAVVRGDPGEEGVWEDLLFRDTRTMKTYIVKRKRAGVRDAKLAFRKAETVVSPEGTLTLVLVRLYTGRTHQIRAQFAGRGYPLCGDGRYGSGDGGDRPALFSHRLALEGVFDCTALPEGTPFDLFSPQSYGKTF